MRWPELGPAHTSTSALVSTLDIFPTIAEATGESLDIADLDGRSFHALLGDPTMNYKRESLVLRDVKGRRALVADAFKYISATLPPGVKGSKLPEELYHLARDPGESDNLVPMMPELVASLRGQLNRISNGD